MHHYFYNYKFFSVFLLQILTKFCGKFSLEKAMKDEIKNIYTFAWGSPAFEVRMNESFNYRDKLFDNFHIAFKKLFPRDIINK